jgi:glycosyltransferase A (GT-A) superfamily protein (DUF2064 family)
MAGAAQSLRRRARDCPHLRHEKISRVIARILVIAKAPESGRSKTRLCPPCTAGQAAQLAEAALVDTLDAVAATPCGGRTIVLDGDPGEWLPEGFEVLPQPEGGLGERLAFAFEKCPAPALLIGMDTPQVSPGLLGGCLSRLDEPGVDAVIGLCPDGGFWAIGFSEQVAGAFEGVPMSSDLTGKAQFERLIELGLNVEELAVLSDVDYFTDAESVAREYPESGFARALRAMEPALA